MRLKLICVRGYKRFGDQSKLDARGPIIAVVGANEAGKTSLLEAMVHISSDQPFQAREHTRGTVINNEEWLVHAEFSLEAEDRALLGDLVPADTDLTYSHYRYPEGNFKYSVGPRIPRDRMHRDQVVAALRQALDDGWLEKLDAPDEEESGAEGEGEEGAPRLFERARALADELNSQEDWLPDPVRQELAALEAVIEQDVPEGVDTDQSELARLLGLATHFENELPPHERIRDVLSPRVPKFLLFDDEHRALSTEYAWEDHPEPTRALENLFALAKTDYQQFRGHAQADDRPTMETMLEAANKALDEAFKAWRQADLHVAFSADHRALHLLVRDRATTERTRLDERSAGLRSFVALIAFCARYAVGVRPVLMVDEAEMHLHYGGQADLVRVFERQQIAETIIYTTHSVGCLPSDLGATIRVVSPVNGESYRSRIYNSFWSAHAGAGLTPMMLAMGADAFAFTPSRRAVIGEGASEAILLPSLVREAQSPEQRDEPLGYQVAPGIAEVDPDDAEALELEAAGVAYLLDGDVGGRGHRRKLSERAKREGRVVDVGQSSSEDALCIEDFVSAEVLASALNRLLARRAGWCGDTLGADELPPNARASYLHTWCKDRDVDIRKLKAQLAAEALDIGRERGSLLEPAHAEQLRGLHQQLLQATETTAAQPETQQDPG